VQPTLTAPQVEARLQLQTPSTLRQTIAPKLGSAQKVVGGMHADPLAVSLLFSSVASIVGSAGHSNYTAANALLDVFADQHAASGVRVMAVQWGAWSSVGKL